MDIKMVTNRIIKIVIVILIIIVSGCHDKDTQNPSQGPSQNIEDKKIIEKTEAVKKDDNQKTVIKVAGYPGSVGVFIQNGAPQIAEELGYFKNIKIEESDLPVGPDSLAAVASGQIDAAHVQYLTIIRAVAKGVKVKAVTSAHGSNVIVFRLYLLDDSSIKSVKDLKGKSVGGITKGSTPYIVFAEYLKANNLSIDDVNLINIPQGQEEQVLRSKQADVVLISLNFMSKSVEERGGVRLLAVLDDILPKGTHHCGLIVSDKFMKERPEILKDFVTGFTKGFDWERDNPDKAKEYYMRFTKEKGFDPKIVDKYYIPTDIRQHAFVDDSDVQWFIDRLEERGELKPGQIKSSDVYTNEINPYYVK